MTPSPLMRKERKIGRKGGKERKTSSKPEDRPAAKAGKTTFRTGEPRMWRREGAAGRRGGDGEKERKWRRAIGRRMKKRKNSDLVDNTRR